MSNNKQSIKLYTEEEILSLLQIHLADEDQADSFVALLTPIELPSDEEIEEYINSTPYYGHCTPEYCEGIEDGIKWVLSKIQGGKK